MAIEDHDDGMGAYSVEGSELVVGNTYFSLNYVDSEMLFPLLEPIVHIGRDLEPDDVGMVYFQDMESHNEGVVYNDAREDAWANFTCGAATQTGHIFEFEEALRLLIRCSERRRKLLGKSKA